MIVGYSGDAEKCALRLRSMGFDVRPYSEDTVYDVFIYVNAKECDLASLVSRNCGIFLLNVKTLPPEDAALLLRSGAPGMNFLSFH